MLRFKSPAKLNIFLKITGKRGDYHEIMSRFIRYDGLYDELIFEPKERAKEGFELSGRFDCELQNNTIYKAYKLLRDKNAKKIDDFFENYTLRVDKRIPSGGGLGGGSSNAATLLLALNKTLSLSLSLDELCFIGSKIGADVSFFLHERPAANVQGVGEIVTPIDDDIPDIELVFTSQACDTAAVYKAFRANFWDKIDAGLAHELSTLDTKEMLSFYSPLALNDLLRGVLVCYPHLKAYADFLSGSGGTFFKVKNKWA